MFSLKEKEEIKGTLKNDPKLHNEIVLGQKSITLINKRNGF